MVIANVLTVFLFILVGFGACRIGWLPVASNKHLSSVVINIAAPCAVFTSVTRQELSMDNIRTVLLLFGVAVAGYLVSGAIGRAFCAAARVPAHQRGVYTNFFMYQNNAFMGFPVTLAIFGQEGLFLLVIMNCVMPLFVYTNGIANVRADVRRGMATEGEAPARKSGLALLKESLNAPIVFTLVALAFYFLGIPVPDMAADVLDMLSATMTPLSMMVIGILLSESRPRAVIGNVRLAATAAIRLVGIPLAFFSIMYLCGMRGLMLAVATLNFLLPCAAVLPAIAEQYGGDSKLAAEGVFLSTLFSIATIPVAAVLLHTL